MPTKEQVLAKIDALRKDVEAMPDPVKPPPVEPPPPAVEPFILEWLEPNAQASLKGTVTLRAKCGPGWKNIEFIKGDTGWQKMGPPATVKDGIASLDLDTTKWPSGPLRIRVQAWDAKANEATKDTRSASFVRDFTIANPVTPSDPTTHNKPGWRLTFVEDFNRPAGADLDTNVWKTWFYFGDRSLPSNGELQYYMDRWFKGQAQEALGVNPFIYTGNSTMIIQALPALAEISSKIWGYRYTSGLITTENSFRQKYGLFEMRAKLPRGKGVWPAFWLLPVDKSWPPEIDVLEAFGGANSRGEGGPSKNHWGVIGGNGTNKDGAGAWVDVGVDMTQDFHMFQCEWSPGLIVWRFDDREIGRYKYDGSIPGGDKEMYLLANIALGGGWAEAPNDQTPWPAQMEIDFIRAYAKEG